MTEQTTVEELATTHSEMLAQAADLGVHVPDDLTLEFTTVETGRTVCDSLDKILSEARAKLQDDKSSGSEESTAQAAPKKAAKPRKKKGQDTKPAETAAEGETEMAATAKKTTGKKTASKTSKKTSSKQATAKKAATAKARSGNVPRSKTGGTALSVASVTFTENSKVQIADKAYIDAQMKKGTDWSARLKKVVAHAGKKVSDFNGPKSDIKWAVIRGAVKIV